MFATPYKLRDESWGVKVQGKVMPGQRVTVRTKSGKSWESTIAKVVWSKDGVSICAVEQREQPARRSNHECHCGACEDLLSFGFEPGQRVRCKECGGWAEAW